MFGPGNGWQSLKTGPGPAPIETAEGWLLLYHALLDLDQPWKVIKRTKDYLLAPTEPYERVGDVPNVCFPSSAVMEGDVLRLYYGCADTCISMAEAKFSEILDFVKSHSF